MSAQEGTFPTLGHMDVTIGDVAARSAELERRMREQGGHAGVEQSCRPITDILTRVGDKWSVMVVMLLGNGTKRFNEMRRLIGGISQRMLTLTLRGLERDGLVTRTVFPTVPPRVDYALTDMGRALLIPISALGTWAYVHRDAVDAARLAFDARNEVV
ncbi:DNA-binding HxlR family transcriptional regulator [Janthinobacterium sp. S3M3]|nr:DNA-binding HxlR family transcriptional regulator [Janthinobacterium sp. S3T4]MBB5616043.1 DNA-binding HxlR family transcriptional regulator [Janthinobacterium sp. S3M3]